MKQDNRVLSRQNARELTARESEHVAGAVRTETLCTFNREYGIDGDVFLGEC